MTETISLRRAALSRPRILPALVGPMVAVALLAGGMFALVLLQDREHRAVDARSSVVWLSGEARGRVVLGAARAQRPSLSIQISDSVAGFDVATADGVVAIGARDDGTIIVLSSDTGRELVRTTGPLPIDARAVVVAVGERVVAVDPTSGELFAVERDGTIGEPVTAPGAITDWVGGDGGLLWFLVEGSSKVFSFDGTRVEQAYPLDVSPGSDLVSVLDEPVVLDRVSAQLRWVRRDASVAVPGLAAPITGPVAIAQQTIADTCIPVVVPGAVSCIDPDGERRRAAIDPAAVADPTSLVLAGDEDELVIARGGSEDVTSLDWATGGITPLRRPAASTRLPVVVPTAGAVVVDDPGAPTAVTVDGGRITELDKFSRRTLVLTTDGSAAEVGVGIVDENAEVAGAVGTGSADEPTTDDNGQNDPPVPVDDRVVTRADRTISIGVLDNDRDPDDDPLVVVGLSSMPADQGAIEILQGSRVRYRPPGGTTNRTVTFEYEVADPSNLRASATVEVEVVGDGSNTAPLVTDDEAITQINTPVEIPVLGNDLDGEGDPLTVTAVSTPDHGSLAIDGGAVVRYEPEPGYVGPDQFTYDVVDGFGGTATATVRVEVVSESTSNRPPVAVPDRLTVKAGVLNRFDPLANDTDPDGDRLRLVSVATLQRVQLVRTPDGQIDVLADSELSGLLSFTYEVEDEQGLKATGRVALLVEAPVAEEAPLASDDRQVSPSVPVSIDVIANDIDPAGTQLVIESVTSPSPSEGTVVKISSTAVQFTPVAGFFGTSRFTYTVRNLAGLTDTATVSVEVTPPTGSGPVAKDDSAVMYLGTPAVVLRPLSNDAHTDRLPFGYAGAPTAAQGSLKVNADRSITYSPPTGQLGAFVIRYQITDEFDHRASARITVLVIERPKENSSPLAVDDLKQTEFDTPIVIDVVANDRDPDEESFRLDDVGQPTAGTGRTEISSGKVRFTPAAGFEGLTSFTYTIVDARGLTSRGTVTVEVRARPRLAPIVNDDLVSLFPGGSASVNPLENDNDPDSSGELRLQQVSAVTPADGLTVRVSGASVRVTSTGPLGTFTIPYTAVDGDGLASGGSIVVTVQAPPNKPPVATNDVANGLGQRLTISVLDNDLDPDGGVLTLVSATVVAPANAGAVSVSGNRLVFDPTSGFSGVATLRYTIADDKGANASATVSVTVTACPTLPSPNPVTATTRLDTPITLPLLTGALPAGWTLGVTQPTFGTVSLPAGSTVVRYTPPAGATGVGEFTSVLTSPCGDIVSSPVRVVVNRAPVGVPDTWSTSRNKTVTLDVRVNDTDPDGDAVQVVDLRNFRNGRADLVAGGLVTFTPVPGYVGPASFQYRIRDPGGLTSELTTVTVSVGNGAPTPVDDARSLVRRAAAVDVDVLVNDTDPDGDALTVTAARVAPAVPVTASVVQGKVRLQLTSGAQVSGRYVVSYDVSDGTATATASILVTVENLLPVTGVDRDSIDLEKDTSVLVDVLGNDQDPDTSSPLTLVSADGGAAGSAIVENGRIRFTPNTAFRGDAQISYVVADADGGRASGILIVTVSGPTTTTTTTPPVTTEPSPG